MHTNCHVMVKKSSKMLTCFDSRDKISECLMVKEQFVLNNFIYQKYACFAVHSIAILKNYLKKHNTFFSLGVSLRK